MENNDFYIKLGNRIERLRKERKMSAESLAEKIGKTKKTIRRYELGEVKISHDNVLEIARVFDKPVSYFYQEALDGEKKEDDNVNAIAAHIREDATEEEIEAIQKFIDFTFSNRKEDN